MHSEKLFGRASCHLSIGWLVRPREVLVRNMHEANQGGAICTHEKPHKLDNDSGQSTGGRSVRSDTDSDTDASKALKLAALRFGYFVYS